LRRFFNNHHLLVFNQVSDFYYLFIFSNKKAELTKGSSFGSSAISFEDPPLSVPRLLGIWLSRDKVLLYMV
jgi:hypothetical protein